MVRPDTLFEALSYDLKQLHERRLADRRAVQRPGADRRHPADGEGGADHAGELKAVPLIVLPPVRE